MFTTLAGALTSANLVTTLQGPGPFTVFAPTDDAFSKLDAIPTGDALKDVLLYHVADGAVGSGDLTAGDVPTLLPDQSVSVNLTNGVKINDSNVTSANIIAKNGVIHVVDTVLIPE
jgi:transforming growth factor-beta-induced protein